MRKCFGVGLNKTGTKTLGAALRILGYRTASFRPELMAACGRGDCSAALAVAREFDGFEDWPWPLIYRELDDAFPGSRFVLTVRRDAATWLASLLRHARRTGPTVFREIAYGYPSPWENETHHLERYARHIDEVTAHFASRPGRLRVLCWERGEGWEELCRFLERPLPAVPFPHENRSPEAG